MSLCSPRPRPALPPNPPLRALPQGAAVEQASSRPRQQPQTCGQPCLLPAQRAGYLHAPSPVGAYHAHTPLTLWSCKVLKGCSMSKPHNQ